MLDLMGRRFDSITSLLWLTRYELSTEKSGESWGLALGTCLKSLQCMCLLSYLCIVAQWRKPAKQAHKWEASRERYLMSWVVLIPKDAWPSVAAPVLLLQKSKNLKIWRVWPLAPILLSIWRLRTWGSFLHDKAQIYSVLSWNMPLIPKMQLHIGNEPYLSQQ